MNNALLLPENEKLSGKCSSPGASRPLAYSTELYDKLLKWIVLRDFHFRVSVMNLQEKARLVIHSHFPPLTLTKGHTTWLQLSLQRLIVV